jgi:hypothetical protein
MAPDIPEDLWWALQARDDAVLHRQYERNIVRTEELIAEKLWEARLEGREDVKARLKDCLRESAAEFAEFFPHAYTPHVAGTPEHAEFIFKTAMTIFFQKSQVFGTEDITPGRVSRPIKGTH